MMRRTVAVALLCLLASAAVVCASEIPDKPARFVADKFSVLSTRERADLEQKLTGFSGTAQIYVYIGRSVPSDTTLEQFSTATFNYWGVGDKAKNNGVLLLLFLRSRKIRIETGDGIRPVLTDKRAAEIIEDMKPYLRAEDYYQAVDRAVGAIMRAAASPVVPAPAAQQVAAPIASTPGRSSDDAFMTSCVGGCAVVFLVIFLIVRLILRAARGVGQAVTFGGPATYGVRTGGNIRVDHYNHQDRRPWYWPSSSGSSYSSSSSSSSSSSLSSGSSSSGSSGGGGHSSGGGASGSW